MGTGDGAGAEHPAAGRRGGGHLCGGLLRGAAGTAVLYPVCPGRPLRSPGGRAAAAGHHGDSPPRDHLRRQPGTAGGVGHGLDHPGGAPGDGGRRCAASRGGPGRDPGTGRCRCVGKAEPAQQQRRLAPPPGGQGDGRRRPALLRRKRGGGHSGAGRQPPVLPPGGPGGEHPGLCECGRRRCGGAGTGIQQPAQRGGRQPAGGQKRLGLPPARPLRDPFRPHPGQQSGADHRQKHPELSGKLPQPGGGGIQRPGPGSGHRHGCGYRGHSGHEHQARL